MFKIIKRYSLFLILMVVNLIILFLKPEIGFKSVNITKDNLIEMLSVIPPIFILLGLLDVWVKKETMIKLLGDKSGLIGMLIAFLLGSVAAGPLYAAFPVAGIMLKKGSKLSNVLIFIGAWSTTKIPLLLFEASSMGWKFMLTRFVINIPGIIIIAWLIQNILNKKEKDMMYENASKLG